MQTVRVQTVRGSASKISMQDEVVHIGITCLMCIFSACNNQQDDIPGT